MSKSAVEMAKSSGVSYATILRQVRKGYFGALETGKNGAYLFPDDMPLPYKTNGKTDRDSTLLKKLLDAADLGRSVHKDMFPLVDSFRYEHMLKYAAEEHLVEIRTPYEGVVQLISTQEGRAVLNAAPKERDQIVEKLLAGVKVAAALVPLMAQCVQPAL